MNALRANMQEQHWALNHEAFQSLLVYARSPDSGDFKELLPRSIYCPGSSMPLQG